MDRNIVLQRGAKQVLLVGLAAVTLGLASTSFASASDNDVRKQTVSYAELDLTKQAGAEALYKRIKRAAFTVCGGYDSPMPWSYTLKSRCYKTALNEAVAKVNSPLLTALHQDKNSRVASK